MLQVGAERCGGGAAAEADAREEFRGVHDPSGVTAWGGHGERVGTGTDILRARGEAVPGAGGIVEAEHLFGGMVES
ncbi:hypothetical protein GCM10027075_53280 [Streptomyces heilongjiangensis]